MEDARIAIENEGYKVVGGYLSPSSDKYVRSKMVRMAKTAGVPLELVFADASHRVRLTQLACADSDWLSCSSWESSQPQFVDFHVVAYTLDTFLRQNSFFRSADDTVFYVCGSDHYNKCGLYKGIYNRHDQKGCHVAVCVRHGQNGDAEPLTPPQSSAVTIVHTSSSSSTSEDTSLTTGNDDTSGNVSLAGLSSTKVRALLSSFPAGSELDAATDGQLRAALPEYAYLDLIRGPGSLLYRI